MKNDNFDKVYNNILNQKNQKFTYQFGEDLPEEYLTDIPQVKQCKFTRHFLIELRNEEEKWNCKITKEILYKNVQKFLIKLFSDKSLMKKIDKNEYKKYHLNVYLVLQNNLIIMKIFMLLYLQILIQDILKTV